MSDTCATIGCHGPAMYSNTHGPDDDRITEGVCAQCAKDYLGRPALRARLVSFTDGLTAAWEPIPEFRAVSRDGHSWVDVRALGTSRVPAWRYLASPVGPFTSMRLANEVADALSAAYRMGSEQQVRWASGPLGSYPSPSETTSR